ncbi:MAG TPA: hypothetical protein VGH24_05890 [Solirubrobacteraceae bacterium]|jgi:hypothetical protein
MTRIPSPRAWRRRRSLVAPLIAALNRWSPFWGPQLVVAAAIILDFALPEKLTLGPSWLLPGVETLLLLGLVFYSPNEKFHHSRWRRRVAIGLIAVVSIVNVLSLVLLAHYLLHGHPSSKNGPALMFSGIALWGTNVLLFALWYYEIDRGGPVARMDNEEYYPDFMFAQMTDDAKPHVPADWKPGLTDYLYLSFTNSTAFSPTDTMPLTAPAKWLMSAQAAVALVIIILVISRAVGIVS